MIGTLSGVRVIYPVVSQLNRTTLTITIHHSRVKHTVLQHTGFHRSGAVNMSKCLVLY